MLIFFAAYRLTARSARDLMDERLPAGEERWIFGVIAAHQPTVRGFHRLRTREAGNRRFADFHIKVNPPMSVEESHGITDSLVREIKERFPDASVTIHIEPCNGDCLRYCTVGCFLDEGGRRTVPDPSTRKQPSEGERSGNSGLEL